MSSQVAFRTFVICLAIVAGVLSLYAAVLPFTGRNWGISALLISSFAPFLFGMPIVGYVLAQKEKLRKAVDELTEIRAELQRHNTELIRKVGTDPMTGMLNREYFLDALKAMRRRSDSGALLIIDADHFKSINDQYGHLAGDEALIALAAAIQRSVRADDVRGRIGGEEFAIMLPGTSATEAYHVAERIRKAVEAIEFMPKEGVRHMLTISIGGIHCAAATELSEMMRNADRCLYAAKNGGRNLVVIDCLPPKAA